MRKDLRNPAVLGLVLAFLAFGGCRAAEKVPKYQVGVGAYGGGSGMASGFVGEVAGEMAFAKKFSGQAQIRHYSYSWEDENGTKETEEGSGTGLGVEARFYPRQAMDGFFVGAGAGVYPFGDWEYKEKQNGRVIDEDSGDDIAWEAHGTVGWMFRLGENIALSPAVTFGTYLSDSPESGAYAGIGLQFMVGF